MAAEDSPVFLEPFVHQVGGHFPIICMDAETLCKPLNSREFAFYETMPESLKPFVPGFSGTMKVEAAEDEQGYIRLKGQLPADYQNQKKTKVKTCQKERRKSEVTHFRLKRKESIEIEVDEAEDNGEGSGEVNRPARKTSSSSAGSNRNYQHHSYWN